MAFYRLPHGMLNKTHVRAQIHKALLTSEICDQSRAQQIGVPTNKKSPIFHPHVHNIRLTRV